MLTLTTPVMELEPTTSMYGDRHTVKSIALDKHYNFTETFVTE